ncbi:MAG: hypothetical protein V1926_02880 [Candidatus Peregrinibacteria bacterium]
MPSCTQCSSAFEITKDDLAFYEKVSPVFNGEKELIPPPTLCPDCRRQRRFAWRNERSLYHRKCDMTGKQIISAYSPSKPFKVYQREEWLSDRWDAITYGRPMDFSRPFFEQFAALQLSVPAMALSEYNNENCSYTNYVATSKNCYLIFGSVYCQDCYYGSPYYSVSCVDSLLIRNCELCCDCITCEKCYGCAASQDCVNCSGCLFCTDCENCISCVNLRNTEYRVFNEQVARETFESLRRDLTKYSALQALRVRFMELLRTQPRRFGILVQCEASSGNNLYHSKNTRDAFDVQRCQDCCHVAQIVDAKDCMDTNYTEEEELCYEYFGSYHNQRQIFSFLNYNSADTVYSTSCHSCHNLFGCIGLQRKEHCILNKQYTKEEYGELVPKIIVHMRKSGEYGEFFPAQYSPFAYNETVAQDYFPMMQEDVLQRGWKWEEQEKVEQNYLGPQVSIPDDMADASDDLCKALLTCETSGVPFKIIPQELRIYRQLQLPLPRICPEQRLRTRMALRNPRKLWNRQCAKCQKPIATSYQPSRPEIVYCEHCYLTSVY